MGLLDGQNLAEYYQGQNAGSYQFTSLEDVITQFEIAYVGEGKILPKAKRSEIAFHAQRALQELSFDTFKSIKSQEIVLPPSLVMLLPHDYVNYTKLSFVDSSGIKHPLYKTNSTSNPFSIKQDPDLTYDFTNFADGGFITNHNFEGANNLGKLNNPKDAEWRRSHFYNPQADSISIDSNQLIFTHGAKNFHGGEFTGSRIYIVYQAFDATGVDLISIDAVATAAAANAALSSGGSKDGGNIRIGVTTLDPGGGNAVPFPGIDSTSFDSNTNQFHRSGSDAFGYQYYSPLLSDDIFTLSKVDGTKAYVDFTVATEETKSFDVVTENILPDSSNKKWVYLVVISKINNFDTPINPPSTGEVSDLSINKVNSIVVGADVTLENIQYNPESTTWANYKAQTPSENNNDDYEDNNYAHMSGNRYGLDPQHAQINGSYYIDSVRGKINFSSNISGKTVILDYISDSLGTDGEMQVHKFAEEAMYKCIAYSMLSTTTYGQQLVPRFKNRRINSNT